MSYDVKVVYGDTNWYWPVESYGRAVGYDAAGERIWVMYDCRIDLVRRMRVAYSDDEGDNWTHESPSGDPEGTQYGMALAVDSLGRPHAVWRHRSASSPYTFQFYHSVRVAGSWSTPTEATSKPESAAIANAYADANGYVHFVFNTAGEYLTYRRYDGPTGGAETDLRQGTDGWWTCANAVAADSDGYAHVVSAWSNFDVTPCEYRLYYQRQDAGGWGEEEIVFEQDTDTSLFEMRPQLVMDADDDLHLVSTYIAGWEGVYAIFAVRYRKRTSGVWGDWETIATQTTGVEDEPEPMVWIANGTPYVAWTGVYFGSSTPSYDDTHWSKRVGGSWAATEYITDDTLSYMGMTATPADGYLVWSKYDVVYFLYLEEAVPVPGYAYFF